MSKKWLGISLLSGIISSFFIGVFFKWIEKTSGIKVYTLLLNIDFIPVINQVKFPEAIEFSFHMIVSTVLTIILYWLFQYLHWGNRNVLFSELV